MNSEEKAKLLANMFQGATFDNSQIIGIAEAGSTIIYRTDTKDNPPHFPLNNNEDVGKHWFDFLVKGGFIGSESDLDSWLYLLGFSISQPTTVKKIEWLKTVETARMMLCRIFENLLNSKKLKKVEMSELASLCFTKNGKPLKLAKPKTEISQDADAIQNFVPTISDL